MASPSSLAGCDNDFYVAGPPTKGMFGQTPRIVPLRPALLETKPIPQIFAGVEDVAHQGAVGVGGQ
jgi:hypothetical protein